MILGLPLGMAHELVQHNFLEKNLPYLQEEIVRKKKFSREEKRRKTIFHFETFNLKEII